ncbi:DUF421 domain-containing protein [Bacillus aquiflavi]|uniref:DUF421 domain-containing protein n=1 Tax=Bacillus aquiflavi TaxID=2672567 RepID=A0A6B3VYS1_9BACI|nr:DUF421 domain-containing protein [Bacillus aquiflavi]MBA4537167.1 DUF421 domain-containing protein [Bacillus aquiflavi]NEY81425.1 DUF421 domain-containing protein [Bacillus aquiflavi]UAC47390.1 DUF421 domain-containing protein [Bacillus aquiflavi]
MEEYLTIILRTFLLYILIFVIFRLMGKREIGELSILDLVVFMMIAEMAAIAIEDRQSTIFYTIVPMVFLMLIQMTLAYFSLKSQRFRLLMDGKPTVIINKGKIDEKAMRSQRYNFDDLLLQLREKDIRNIADVEFAILETSGRLSVIKKEKNKKKSGEITLPLIVDGNVRDENLTKINKTNFWLRQELRKRGYDNLKDISFCSFQDGQFFIDLKDGKEQKS